MKKNLFALVIATAAFAPAAMAQNYVVAGVGSSKVDLDCAGAATCDTSGTAFKFAYGIDFGGWALELGLADFGKAKAADSGVTANARASAVSASAAWHIPMSDSFGLSARLGVAYVKAKLSGTVSGVGSASISDSKAKPLVGLGLTYSLNKATKVELGADFTKAEIEGEKADLRAVTIGVRYAF